MFAVMEQWPHAGTSFLFIFAMAMIIYMFYNIYFLHASFTCIYFANTFAPQQCVQCSEW